MRFGVRCAHVFWLVRGGYALLAAGFDFDSGFGVLIFLSPERRLDQAQAGGGLGEDCLSAQREFRSPACLRLSEGTPEGGGKPGSPFLRLPSFGDAKEGNLLPGNPRRFWFYIWYASTGSARTALGWYVCKHLCQIK